MPLPVPSPALPHRPRRRRGAALLITLILSVVMLAIVGTMVLRVSSERRTASDDAAQAVALAVAQSGLERYLAALGGAPRTGTDSTRADTTFAVEGGTATIAARRVRSSSAGSLYLVVSRGSTGRYRPSFRSPNAERAVAQYVEFSASSFDMDAAFTSLIGTDKNGNSGSLSGVDACGRRTTLPGVAGPTGSYTGHTGPIDGTPDNAAVGLGTAGPSGTARQAISLDWPGIVGNTVMPADAGYDFPSMPSRSTWDARFPTSLTSFPVTHIEGDADFTASFANGRGILVVTGNLVLSGSWRFDGIVLVGGRLDSNGNNTLRGAILSGLNVLRGQTVTGVNQLNGNKTFQYDSCLIDSAMTRYASARPVANGRLPAYPLF